MTGRRFAAKPELPDPNELADQNLVVRDLLAWAGIGILAVASFMFGAFGFEAFTQSAPPSAIAATIPTAPKLAPLQPDAAVPAQNDQTAADVLKQEAPPVWNDADAASANTSGGDEEIVEAERMPKRGRPPKPAAPPEDAQAADIDDPWAALESAEAAAAAAEGGDPVSDEQVPDEASEGETN